MRKAECSQVERSFGMLDQGFDVVIAQALPQAHGARLDLKAALLLGLLRKQSRAKKVVQCVTKGRAAGAADLLHALGHIVIKSYGGSDAQDVSILAS